MWSYSASFLPRWPISDETAVKIEVCKKERHTIVVCKKEKAHNHGFPFWKLMNSIKPLKHVWAIPPCMVHTTPAHAIYGCVLHLLTPYMVAYYTHSHHIWLYTHGFINVQRFKGSFAPHPCSSQPWHQNTIYNSETQNLIAMEPPHQIIDHIYIVEGTSNTNMYHCTCTNFTQKLYIATKNIEQLHSPCSPTSQ